MKFRYQSHEYKSAAILYKTIRLLEHQQCDIAPSTLAEFGPLFVRHQMHQHFGLCLLHRHYDIDANSVMVHSSTPDGVDLCQPEMVGARDIQPCAFFSTSRLEFVPFEYEASAVHCFFPLPTESFLRELANLLWKHGLESVLGLCRSSPANPPTTEIMLMEGRCTVTSRVSPEALWPNGIATEWGFLVDDDGKVHVKCMKSCKEQESGGHIRQ